MIMPSQSNPLAVERGGIHPIGEVVSQVLAELPRGQGFRSAQSFRPRRGSLVDAKTCSPGTAKSPAAWMQPN